MSSANAPAPGMPAGSPPPMRPQPPTSGLAIASLVLSILGLGLPAVICGHLALGSIKRSGGTEGGKGLAIAGLVIGYLSMLVGIFVIIAVLAAGAAIKERIPIYETRSDIVSLSLALSTYRTEYGEYPMLGGAEKGKDFSIVPDQAFLDLMTGQNVQGLNSSEVAFLEREADWNQTPEGVLADQWGNPLEIYVDGDGDGTITVDGVPFLKTVGARSAGPDGEPGTEDDVTNYFN